MSKMNFGGINIQVCASILERKSCLLVFFIFSKLLLYFEMEGVYHLTQLNVNTARLRVKT